MTEQLIKYALFLRGVNVGGNTMVNMADFKKSLGENNLFNIRTYINSGNITLETIHDKDVLIGKIRKIIFEKTGHSIEMVVKTVREINQIIENDPFDRVNETDNAKKIVVMLSHRVDNSQILQLRDNPMVEENFYIKDDVIYVYYHNGTGKSKFNNNFIEKKIKAIATSRNWNTILKVSSMFDSDI